MKQCPLSLNKKHKWRFVKNTVVRTQSLYAARICKKGVYDCACGETKYGEPR